jgi:hypothetical protein
VQLHGTEKDRPFDGKFIIFSAAMETKKLANAGEILIEENLKEFETLWRRTCSSCFSKGQF